MAINDVGLGDMWLFGFSYFVTFYTFCSYITMIKTFWQLATFFPLTGSWADNEWYGDKFCREMIAPLL